MNVLFFSSKVYDSAFFNAANAAHQHQLSYLEVPLNKSTAVLAKGYEAVCIFVNDIANAEVLQLLADQGVKLIWIETPPPAPEWDGVRDRLVRAGRGHAGRGRWADRAAPGCRAALPPAATAGRRHPCLSR